MFALALTLVLSTSPPPPVTVLKAARLFDGKSDRLLSPAAVLVEGTTIRAVGAQVAAPAGATVVELGDVTLMPGMMDAHTHLSGEMGDNYDSGTLDFLRKPIPEIAVDSV